MRIWIVNHYAYTPRLSAGTRHYELARALMALGHEVLIVSTGFYHKARVETVLAPGESWRREDVDGVPFLWLRTPPYQGSGVMRFWNMTVFATRVLRRTGLRDEPAPDVILGSSPDLLAARAAWHLARRLGVPFVLEVRDVWPDSLIEIAGLGRGHPLVVLLRRLEHQLYRDVDHIVSVLPRFEDYVRQLGFSNVPVTWIPNGVALDAPPARRQPDGEFVFLYAGAHGPSNHLEALINGFAELERQGCQGTSLRLVGDGPDKFRLEESCRRRGLESVSFLPPVPKHRIMETLGAADAFALAIKPSPIYQWGVSLNKLFDYMAAARPVLFCGSVAANPVVEAGAGITVEDPSPENIADAIREMAGRTPAHLASMGTRGRRYVEAHHDYTLLAQRLLGVLRAAPLRSRHA